MSEPSIDITLHAAIADIPADAWDALACPEAQDGGRPFDPFTTHRFLLALERSHSVGGRSGWQPHPMLARRGGALIAATPMFAKRHSQGEYIFDHNWADAFGRAGATTPNFRSPFRSPPPPAAAF